MAPMSPIRPRRKAPPLTTIERRNTNYAITRDLLADIAEHDNIDTDTDPALTLAVIHGHAVLAVADALAALTKATNRLADAEIVYDDGPE